ncbi:hypothetical protein Dimus_001755, partial [Dionaea muscipula]
TRRRISRSSGLIPLFSTRLTLPPSILNAVVNVLTPSSSRSRLLSPPSSLLGEERRPAAVADSSHIVAGLCHTVVEAPCLLVEARKR